MRSKSRPTLIVNHFTSILLFSTAFLFFSCNEIPDTIQTQKENKTSISDSAYYYFDLGHLESTKGFYEFFEDTAHVQMVEDYYDEFGRVTTERKKKPLESLFMMLWMRAAVIDLVHNRIVLSQKEAPVLSGWHKGTMNQSTLNLRPNNTFDIHWTGWWLSSNLYEGTYRQVSDTLFLKFETEQPERVRDTLIIKKNRIAPLDSTDYAQVNFFFPKNQRKDDH